MEIAFLIVIVAALLASMFGSGIPKRYRIRECQGKAWKVKFPDHSNFAIRSFLKFFVDSFGFHDAEKLQFEPDDKLMDVYKELYPYKWMADGLEFETLSQDLEEKYKIDISGVWHDDFTLGELFVEIQNA